jgi:hypothetical protein
VPFLTTYLIKLYQRQLFHNPFQPIAFVYNLQACLHGSQETTAERRSNDAT